MVRLSLGYPDPAAELDLLQRKQNGNPLDRIICVADHRDLAMMRAEAERVFVDDKIFNYAIKLSITSRNNNSVFHGASPRATIAVISMAKAAAWVCGRDYVIPEDVKTVFPATITHRLLLTAESKASGKTAQDVVEEILNLTPAPVVR